MNTHCIKPQFAPALGPLFAKFAAFCRKTQCNMPLNAVRFGAKRKVKWCKTQCVLMLNTVQNVAKYKMKSINIHCNGINKPF